MEKKYLPIGFFDSGFGGLSVVKEAIKLMPNEDIIYFGDAKNAPYGDKSLLEIKKLVFNSTEFLLEKGIKALCVACNTATAAAIKDLREKYVDIPIIGIEPAIKPAVDHNNGGSILVLATKATIKLEKYHELLNRLNFSGKIDSIACSGLMDFVERGNYSKEEIFKYFDETIKEYCTKDLESVVLGCTHYPFIKEELKEYLNNPNVKIIDGSFGTAKQILRKLEENNLVNDQELSGTISIYNSLNDDKVIERSFELLEK